MTKQFDFGLFTEWRQDTQDYSMIDTKDAYVARISNDTITYCVKVLGMMPQQAWIEANNVHIKESKRLGL